MRKPISIIKPRPEKAKSNPKLAIKSDDIDYVLDPLPANPPKIEEIKEEKPIESIPGDVNKDGVVNEKDLSIVHTEYAKEKKRKKKQAKRAKALDVVNESSFNNKEIDTGNIVTD